MTEHARGHLTDDQFADCALSTPDAAASAHLATCEACRSELEGFSASISAFENSSLSWAEEQPRPSLRAVVATQRRRNFFLAPAAYALATAAAVAIGVPAWHHAHQAPTAAVAIAETPASDSSAQIADDNQLMQSVNIALATEEPSPLAEYKISVSGTVPHKSRLESSYR